MRPTLLVALLLVVAAAAWLVFSAGRPPSPSPSPTLAAAPPGAAKPVATVATGPTPPLPGTPAPSSGTPQLARPTIPAKPAASATAQAQPVPRFNVETAARGLEVPWALAFAPDGRVFISERPGRIRILEHGQMLPTPWATLPVAATSEGGLLGLALHPQFPIQPYIFAFYTYRGPEGRLVNRLVRLREQSGVGIDPQTLLDGIAGAPNHDGGGIAFGPDGKLYVTTGDAAQRAEAPRLTSLLGKILRLDPDGAIPADNPFPASPVYSLGHRNPQGLAWDAAGRLYASEHGPSGEDGRCCHDEVNLIVPGGNYGWPTYAGVGRDPRFRDPVAESGTDTWAPSGAAFWHGSLFVGALRGQHLRRLAFAPDGAGLLASEALLAGQFGRLRAVAAGPDGALWVTTSNRDGRGRPAADDDRVLRLVPER